MGAKIFRCLRKPQFWLGLGALIAWVIGELLTGISDEIDMRDIAREVYKEERAKER